MQVELNRNERYVIRRALARLYTFETARMKKIKAGIIKRIRASEQAMAMAEISMLHKRFYDLIDDHDKADTTTKKDG